MSPNAGSMTPVGASAGSVRVIDGLYEAAAQSAGGAEGEARIFGGLVGDRDVTEFCERRRDRAEFGECQLLSDAAAWAESEWDQAACLGTVEIVVTSGIESFWIGPDFRVAVYPAEIDGDDGGSAHSDARTVVREGDAASCGCPGESPCRRSEAERFGHERVRSCRHLSDCPPRFGIPGGVDQHPRHRCCSGLVPREQQSQDLTPDGVVAEDSVGSSGPTAAGRAPCRRRSRRAAARSMIESA